MDGGDSVKIGFKLVIAEIARASDVARHVVVSSSTSSATNIFDGTSATFVDSVHREPAELPHHLTPIIYLGNALIFHVATKILWQMKMETF